MPDSPMNQGGTRRSGTDDTAAAAPDADEAASIVTPRQSASTVVVLEVEAEVEDDSSPVVTSTLLQSSSRTRGSTDSVVEIEESPGRDPPSQKEAVGRAPDPTPSNYVAEHSEDEVRASSSTGNPPESSTPQDSQTGTGPRSPPPVSAAAASTSPPNPEMSGNSEFHDGGPHSSRSTQNASTSSSRRQRNGLFGLNFDLNFDPSSWLVPSNVAGRSISSLSMLPDWVRHPANIIPNRAEGASSSGPSEGTSRQGHHHDPPHHHHPSTSSAERGAGGSGGAASRFVSHHHPLHQGTSWNSSFATRSVVNMQADDIPVRTRHAATSMRYIDEDADYNPVSTLELNSGRDRRDPQSYVIDMDTGVWTEEGSSQARGAVGGAGGAAGGGGSTNDLSSASAPGAGTGDDSPSNGRQDGSGPRRSTTSENSGIGGGGGEGEGEGNAPAGDSRPRNDRTRAAEILRDAPETRAFINELGRYTTIRPFIVINFLKGIFDHGTGILAFVALLVTFSHANSMVKKEVSKQRKRNLLYLSMIVINLAACVAFIYYIFNEMELYYALAFLATATDLTSFWSLMWAVAVTDYIAKFGTVFVKIFVVSLPGCLIPFQKRGKYYLFIEHSSQLYRSFLPMHPWLIYLVSAYEGSSRMFGLFLAGLYIFFKLTDSVARVKEWLKTLEKLLSNVHYGTAPTKKQLDSAGTICPICHDTYSSATRLACSHIFCEECVATWFDRERTCPMCRAKVVDDPTYRDGSTSQYIQLF